MSYKRVSDKTGMMLGLQVPYRRIGKNCFRKLICSLALVARQQPTIACKGRHEEWEVESWLTEWQKAGSGHSIPLKIL